MITGAMHAINLTALEASEHSKETKHGPFYSPIGFSFLPFVASCFGRLGLTAIGFLAALAQLELERHDQWLAAHGLDPLVDPSVRAQYRQLCFRHHSAHLGHALAKATVLRLLATLSLPSSTTPSRAYLARNCPGPADSLLSFSDASSLPLSSSLPPSHSLKESLSFSPSASPPYPSLS
jgi:hypothetical protein